MTKFVLLFFLFSAPVFAQTPAGPAAPPAPMAAPPIAAMMAPVAPAPMKAAVPAMVAGTAVPAMTAVPPAPMTTPVTAEPVASEDPTVPNLDLTDKVPGAVADATAPATMSATPVGGNTPAAPVKTPVNWAAIITAIGMVITATLTLLGGFGYLAWTKNARVQLILKATKKGTEAFLAYAEKSPAAWDDIIAKILDNTNAVLLASGQDPMTAAEKTTAKTLATSFKTVAGK